MSDASARLWSASSLNEGLEAMLAGSMRLLEADMGNVQLLDEERRVLRIAVHHGLDQDFLDHYREVSAEDEGACGRALRTGARVVIEDVETDPSYAPFRTLARATGYRSVQSTPLMRRDGRPLGVITTHWRASRALAERDLRVLDLYARQATEFVERWRLDSALRDSEERFRHMADSSPVLIWISGTDRSCTWFNRSWLEFVGRTMEQEIGSGWAEGVHVDDFDRCLRTYNSSFDARRPFSMEYRLRRHDGEYRWIMDEGIPLFDRSGGFTGYIGSCIDITERKQSEEALQEADRRKDEFLAVMAHELRNPLGPIRTSAHFLRLKDPADPDLRRSVETIERQVSHMARIIDDLLDVSRLATGVLALRLGQVDLGEVVQAAIDACRDDVAARGHAVHVDIPAESVRMKADRDRLIQVLCNLISNAARYTPSPNGSIEIRARAEGEVLEIEVQDNGRGIPEARLTEIFDLFVQVDHPRGQGGLGIGLTLARQLVSLHGGTIEARSEGPHRGSTFLVTLPILTAAAAAADRDDATPVTESRRVLVADDNRDAAESLALLLQMAGHVTHVAFDGEGALEAAGTFRPEIAILDIGMPGMDGHEVARRLRRESWGQSIHLVALTGWGQGTDRRRAKDAGFDTHLVKPARPEAVMDLIAAAGGRGAATIAK